MQTTSPDAYGQILRHAERAAFQLDDVLSLDQQFDFTRPFLPEALVRGALLPMLDAEEQLVLNQVRAHAYLSTFGLVEELILPFLLDHLRARSGASDQEVRALLQFAGEEAKHIELFRRFQHTFRRGFGSDCGVMGPAHEIARAVLSHPPLGVALAILHIEWMTQAHYLESVRDDGTLEPRFKELLRCHWMEEAQHARLDALIVEALAAGASEQEKEHAIEGYLAIGGILADGLEAQVELDLEACERKLGRRLPQRDRVRAVQRAANRYTYLGSGMRHPQFLRSLAALGAPLQQRVIEVTPSFC